MNNVKSERPIIFYFNGTFINRENGAHVRASDALSFLTTISERVIVYSYRNHPTCPWRAAEIKKFIDEYPNIELVLEEYSFLLKIRFRLILYVSMIWPSVLAPLLGFAWPKLSPRLSALRCRVVDPIYLITYARGLIEINGAPRKDVFAETQDLYFLNSMKQQGLKPTDLKVLLKARSELAILSYAHNIIAISLPETNFFRLFIADGEVFYIPYFGNLKRYIEHTPSESSKNFIYDVLFVGSDNIQNVNGIIQFIKSHENWLKGRSFAIAGKVCLSNDVRTCAENVGCHLLGFVDDLGLLYKAAKIVVSPVDGTGLKIKVLEALAAGKPVFGSAHTLAGLPPGFEGCVLPIDEIAMDAAIFDDVARHSIERASINYFNTLLESGDLTLLSQHFLDRH